jgi:glutamate-ammonia-ligase adenylyltransferase
VVTTALLPQPLVDASADPEWVRNGLDRLVAARSDAAEQLAASDELAATVVAVMAASRSLTNLLITDPAALDQLDDLDRREPVDAGSSAQLAAWKRREYLRIAARDLTGAATLEATGAGLSRMAADVLQAACMVVGAVDLAVIGMGKLAGEELNYASDVDIVFVCDGNLQGATEAARALLRVVRESFRVDVELRPEGKDGALVRTLESYEVYWDRWAEPWEFQALLKARPVAGIEGLGDAWAGAAAARLWSRPFSAADIAQLRHLKARSEAIARSADGDEVKRGRGGIRDVEFTVQLLQLVHGRHDPGLRVAGTLPALQALADGGYIDPEDADDLADGYRFLRRVEHAVQMVQEQQSHVVPSEPRARSRLARVLGFNDDRRTTALQRFDRALSTQQGRVREIHERVYFRPLLETFTEAGFEATKSLEPEELAARMAAMGFTEVERARTAVLELTRGLGRGARVMHQLLPLILGWLATTPDPDLGLLNLRLHASGRNRARLLAHQLRDSPETVRRLAVVAGSSREVSDLLRRSSDPGAELASLESAGDPTSGLEAGAAATLAAPDPAKALRLFKQQHWARIAAADLCGVIDPTVIGRRLGALADAVIGAALELVDPQLPFAVVAMGRYGGRDLTYPSDLDLVFAYDGGTAQDQAEADRVAQDLRSLVGPNGPDRIYAIDLDLRPDGRKGALTRSLNGFRIYFERWAAIWERQAMIRSRFVAGDARTGNGLVLSLAPFVWGRDPTPEDLDEIRHVKRRIEREKLPRGVAPLHHLKVGHGGLVDVEFAVQFRQLETGARGQNTLDALANLRRRSFIDGADADALEAAYRWAVTLRNRVYLLGSRTPDVLPTEGPGLDKLAISLGVDSQQLLEEHDARARDARAVVERVMGLTADG